MIQPDATFLRDYCGIEDDPVVLAGCGIGNIGLRPIPARNVGQIHFPALGILEQASMLFWDGIVADMLGQRLHVANRVRLVGVGADSVIEAIRCGIADAGITDLPGFLGVTHAPGLLSHRGIIDLSGHPVRIGAADIEGTRRAAPECQRAALERVRANPYALGRIVRAGALRGYRPLV